MTGPTKPEPLFCKARLHSGHVDKDSEESSGTYAETEVSPVAVLICVHAGADPSEFEQALASMQAQTYSDLRFYIYCDGPLKPAHEEVLSFHLDTGSGRDHIVRGDRPAGLPTGLNVLIDRAMLDPDIAFLARMDADDISRPERIEQQVKFLTQNSDVAVAGTWCIEFAEFGIPLFHKELPTSEPAVKQFMLFRNPLAHPTVMFRRSVFEDGNRYDTQFTLNQDYELWSRLVIAGYRISNVPEFLLWFRMSKDFFSRRGPRRAASEIKIRIRYARQAGLVHPLNYFKYAALFLLRISPVWLKRFAYMRLR
jgi:hypothetical protein